MTVFPPRLRRWLAALALAAGLPAAAPAPAAIVGELPPVDSVFVLSARATAPNRIEVRWKIGHFEEPLLPRRGDRLHVVLEEGLVRLALLQPRVLARHLLQPPVREEELHLQGLFAPERAVVVEGGDALGRGEEVRAAGISHAPDEIEDEVLGRAGPPKR